MFERWPTYHLSARDVIFDVAVKFFYIESLLKVWEIAMLSGMQKLKSPEEHSCSMSKNWMAKEKYANNDYSVSEWRGDEEAREEQGQYNLRRN